MSHRYRERNGSDTAGTDWANPQDARPIDTFRSAKNVSCDAASMHKTILVDASCRCPRCLECPEGVRCERRGRGAGDEGEVRETIEPQRLAPS